MIRIFTKRHERAIYDKTLKVSLPRRLRKRLMPLLQKHNYSYGYQPDPNDRWTVTTNIVDEIPGELCSRYGVEALQARNEKGERVAVGDLKGFIENAYPSQLLDVIELFCDDLAEDLRAAFQRDVNNLFEEESTDWRLADGQFFRVDSHFLQLHVIARTHELLKAHGYEGALEEFKEARNDLTAGDYKGAIHNACKSFESALKAYLRKESGNASALIKALGESAFYLDIPSDVARGFGDQVLLALPFLRNRLGGHGQGEQVTVVPRAYAELAIHLAGSFIVFLTRQAPETPAQEVKKPQDDEVPF